MKQLEVVIPPPRNSHKVQESHVRLGKGRPARIGGSGARAITKSTSQPKTKRILPSRNVKAVQETIPEEGLLSPIAPSSLILSILVDPEKTPGPTDVICVSPNKQLDSAPTPTAVEVSFSMENVDDRITQSVSSSGLPRLPDTDRVSAPSCSGSDPSAPIGDMPIERSDYRSKWLKTSGRPAHFRKLFIADSNVWVGEATCGYCRGKDGLIGPYPANATQFPDGQSVDVCWVRYYPFSRSVGCSCLRRGIVLLQRMSILSQPRLYLRIRASHLR